MLNFYSSVFCRLKHTKLKTLADFGPGFTAKFRDSLSFYYLTISMMYMRTPLPAIIFVGFLFSFLLTSCRDPKDLEFREFKNLTVENIGFTGANLNVDAVLYNPNNFSLELKRTDFDIFVDSTLLGHSMQDLQVKVPKRQEFQIPLKVELDMKNLLKNGLATFINKQVLIRVIGKVKVGKAGVFKTFDIDYQTLQQFSF
jgi:hypothetical protein